MKNILRISFVCVLCWTIVFSSCSSDKKTDFIEGDTSALKVKITECYTTLNEASLLEYEQVSIDEFKKKIEVIDKVVTTEQVSEQEVINLTTHLNLALSRFLNSKMSEIPLEKLLASWNFDEDEGGIELQSEGTRGLVATMATGPAEIFKTEISLPQFVEDGKNKALYFKNGSHLEVRQYNPSDFLGKQLSIVVWLKPEVIKGGNYVVSLNYWENWKLQIQEQGKAFFTIHTNAGYTDADNEADLSVRAGVWAHVVISLDLDASSLTMYVNGGEKVKEWTNVQKPYLTGAQASAYQSPLGELLPLMIGASTTYKQAKAAWGWDGWDKPTTWDHFEGLMDEIKFYDTALNIGQVKWLYNLEAPAFQK